MLLPLLLLYAAADAAGLPLSERFWCCYLSMVAPAAICARLLLLLTVLLQQAWTEWCTYTCCHKRLALVGSSNANDLPADSSGGLPTAAAAGTAAGGKRSNISS
ncbi:hypothetical protein Emed_007026 [Eimeria media]